MSSREYSHVLASFHLENCTYRGRILDPLETDPWVEEQFFEGWRNALMPAPSRWSTKNKGSSFINVVDDADRPALDLCERLPILFINGDASWADYEIECEVRCMMTEAFPYAHDENTWDFKGKTGIAFRVQDSRRHYFAGFEHGSRLVVAARDDANWIVLNATKFDVDRRRYYRLTARCEGERISVYVDGEPLLIADDSRWPQGPAGVYANCQARWYCAEVRATQDEAAAVETRRAEHAQAVASAAASVPAVEKLDEFAFSVEQPEQSTFTLFDDEKRHFLFTWDEAVDGTAGKGLLVCDRDGRTVWRRIVPCPGGFTYAAADLDLDGVQEIVALTGTEMLVLDGGSGETKANAEYPEGCPFITLRGEKARFSARSPHLWHTNGFDQPARIFLAYSTGAGGYTIWCYDHELQHRWTHQNYAGKYGHNIASYDVNDDGRAEVVAGYYCLDDDGQVVWRVRDQDLIYKQDHTDNLWVGPMGEGGGGRPKIVAACGEGGVIFIDARSGEILAQRRGLGHMQRLTVGWFRHDLPGLQTWAWTDWGSPGIYCLFDENARLLHRFQPDPRVTTGSTVTWWPDGRQLLSLPTIGGLRALWDGYGRPLVDLSILPQAPSCMARLLDTGTDQFVVLEGDRLSVYGPRVD